MTKGRKKQFTASRDPRRPKEAAMSTWLWVLIIVVVLVLVFGVMRRRGR
jgi:hypothetical protein